MADGKIHIHKVWRSEIVGLVMFGLLCIGTVVVSRAVPGSIITGELFVVGDTQVNLSLPLLWLIPFAWLTLLTVRIYNVLYVADSRGLESFRGILSLNRTITRIRYEDVRSIEADQTLIERLLDVGNVEVGTAASADVDLIMIGVANPKAIQDFIQNERDRRQQVSVQDQQQVSSGSNRSDDSVRV